jgi:hypothetical protein
MAMRIEKSESDFEAETQSIQTNRRREEGSAQGGGARRWE